MPSRRTSTRTVVDESEDDLPQTQLRRSTRNTTARDKGHLNYDLRYHPADDELRPANARRRKQAHGIPVPEPTVRQTTESDWEEESTILISSDDGSGNYASRADNSRKRSRRSSTIDSKRRKRNSFEGSGLRCSTITDIEQIAKRYVEAWDVLVKELPPADAFELRTTQHTNAWEELATQRAEPTLMDIDNDTQSLDDIDHNFGRNNGPNEDELSQRTRFKPMSSSTQHPPIIARLGLEQPSLIDTRMDDEMFGLASQPSRSSQGIASSFQEHLDDQGDAEAEAVQAVPIVRSISPLVNSLTPTTSVRTGTPRRRRHGDIVIHEEQATQWLEKTRRTSSTYAEDPKENNPPTDADDDEPNEGPSRSRASAVAQGAVTPKPNATTPRASSGVDDNEDDRSETDSNTSSKEHSDSQEEDDDEDDKGDEDVVEQGVKSEPMSSAIRRNPT